MLKLRKFLCWCFGIVAFGFLLIPLFAIPAVLRAIHDKGFSPVTRGYVVFLAVSLVLGVPYGMAWWTVKKQKAFARVWAIIASIGFVLISVLPIFYRPTSTSRFHHQFGIFDVFVLALGIAGILAFARRDAMATPINAAKPARIRGDGTSNLGDGVAWLIGIAGYICGMFLWHRWGHDQGLPYSRGYLHWLQLLLALLLTVTIHECGHAAVGIASGMKLRAFIIGPFQWRIRDGRWYFQFLPAGILSGGGATGVVPTNPGQSPWEEIFMIAAGPMASLFAGLAAMGFAFTAKGEWDEPYWEFYALVSTISLIGFAVNLIPMQPEGQYSDGARIYQLLKGGPWADLHRVQSIVTSTLVTPLRPKDYDIEAIRKAERSFPQGIQAMLLRMHESSYFLDRGEIPQARDAFVEAGSIFQASVSDAPAELLTAFVFRSALLCRNAASARQWWERMEAKKPTHLGVDYWLAQSALCWVENRKYEANEAWDKGNTLAQRLPAAGAYEFDRYRCTLLHQVLNESPSEEESAAPIAVHALV